MEPVGVVLLGLSALCIYFVPAIVGWNKVHSDGIIAVNLFLGWTLLGWVAALAWAFSSPRKQQVWNYVCPKCGYKHQLNQVVQLYVCPQCHEKTPISDFELE